MLEDEKGMEEAERQLKHQHRVYYLGRSPMEGDPSKRATAHCHTQAWARYRGASGKVSGRSLRDTVAGQPRMINCR
jgi:hypothetical protein